jgi:hypothetical protein
VTVSVTAITRPAQGAGRAPVLVLRPAARSWVLPVCGLLAVASVVAASLLHTVAVPTVWVLGGFVSFRSGVELRPEGIVNRTGFRTTRRLAWRDVRELKSGRRRGRVRLLVVDRAGRTTVLAAPAGRRFRRDAETVMRYWEGCRPVRGDQAG